MLEAITYASQAVESAKSGQVKLAAKYFLAAHATRSEEKDFTVPVLKLFQFFREYGIEMSENDLNQLLSELETQDGIELLD